VARNRIFFGPHETNLARGRALSDRHVAYYRRRAAGGAGVIVAEEASVERSDWPYERAPLAEEASTGWARIADACRAEGALVVAALGHAGGQGSSAYSQMALLAPSRVPEVSTREVPKWMEQSDIDAVVAGFGRAAAAAVAAGLDGVEINAGQYSLVRQFLSGLTNHRSDPYGEDRTLFARQVLAAVRDGMGDAVLGLRLSCDELAPWAGITPDAAVELALALADRLDYLVVVRGSIYSASATRPDSHTAPGFNLELAALLRAGLPAEVKVVAQGSIVDPAQAEAAVAAGEADAVEMTRAQIAEPELAYKLSVGVPVRPCILCNQACQVRDARNPLVSCVGEPRSGHELEDPEPAPAPAALRLLVVGAGPAGLECARVAAGIGHRVTVVERRAWSGGMLRVAAQGTGRQRLAALADWLAQECERLGVEVVLGADATAADVAAHDGPVVIATGSAPGRRLYHVEPGARVLTAAEVLEPGVGGGPGAAGLAGHEGPVVVWDPVGGPVGVSVAETVRQAGGEVSLVTPDLIVGNELSRSGDLAPANVRLQAAGVGLVRRSLLRRVEAAQVVVEDRFTAAAVAFPATVLVDAGHRLPEDGLWRQTGCRLARIGDAVAPRSVHEAVLEGRRAAMALSLTAPVGVSA